MNRREHVKALTGEIIEQKRLSEGWEIMYLNACAERNEFYRQMVKNESELSTVALTLSGKVFHNQGLDTVGSIKKLIAERNGARKEVTP